MHSECVGKLDLHPDLPSSEVHGVSILQKGLGLWEQDSLCQGKTAGQWQS